MRLFPLSLSLALETSPSLSLFGGFAGSAYLAGHGGLRAERVSVLGVAQRGQRQGEEVEVQRTKEIGFRAFFFLSLSPSLSLPFSLSLP